MKYLKKAFIISFLFFFIMFIISTNIKANTDISTYSPVCLLMESKTGKVLYEKNGYDKKYPASTTKIMTAILAIESCNLDDVTTASYNAIHSVPYSYTNANIQVGENLTIEQLLNVLLIPSANDAANILAEYISGSIENFCNLMNLKASEIGCLNTHFVNANGVHNENHYSTAYDLALIGRYAMQKDIFREIVRKTYYSLPATNMYPSEDRVFNTSNDLIRPSKSGNSNRYYYEEANGIKTGYTDAAKSCIVSSASKDGVEYIVVILGGGTLEDGSSERNLDCINLFNYAFENYSLKTLNEANSVLETIKVKKANSATKDLDVIVQDEITVPLKRSKKIDSVTPLIELDSDLHAPFSKDTVIGKITYSVDGTEYSSMLLAGSDVVEANPLVSFVSILGFLFVVYLLFKLTDSKGKKKSRKNKNRNGKKTKKNSLKSKYSKNDKDDNYLYW